MALKKMDNMINQQASVSKVMKEPILVEFTDSVKKLKKNIMVFSFISLFITVGGIKISPESTFFGLKFSGLNNELIFKGLLLLLVYMLIHFLWCSYESLQEWEVKTTGTKKAFIPSGPYDAIDDAISHNYPSDPRNSTLYYWWSTQASKIANIKNDIESANKKVEELEEIVHSLREGGSELSRNTVNISTHVDPVKIAWIEMGASIKVIEQALNSEQVLTSMRTFDRRYKFFLKTQNIRWLLIDFIAPITLAVLAIGKMVDQLV
jgi:hypothetical protein